MPPTGPTVYTPERVKELAQSLETYFDCTSHIFFESWASSENLHMRQVRRIAEANEDFAEVFERCGCIQASRILEGATIPMDTTGNRTVYPVNPRMATLVLQSKHGYKQQQEVALTEVHDGLRLDSAEACDEAIRQAEERKRQFQAMLEQARELGPAIVEG